MKNYFHLVADAFFGVIVLTFHGPLRHFEWRALRVVYIPVVRNVCAGKEAR